MKYKYKVGEKVKVDAFEKQQRVTITGRGMDKCRLIYFYDDEEGNTKYFYEHQVLEDKQNSTKMKLNRNFPIRLLTLT